MVPISISCDAIFGKEQFAFRSIFLVDSESTSNKVIEISNTDDDDDDDNSNNRLSMKRWKNYVLSKWLKVSTKNEWR